MPGMMKPLQLLAGMATLLAATAGATTNWDDAYVDPNAPFMEPVADDGFDAAPGVDPIYSTPSIYEDTGHRYPVFVPNDVYVEYLGNMTFNGGYGHVRITNASLSMPFVNPRRAVLGGWHLDVKGAARLTWLDCEGRNLLDEDNLYTIGVQAVVSHKVGQGSQVQLGFTPQFSTDCDVMSHHNFFLGGYAAFSSKAGERLRYTLGLAYMPDYYRSVVLPVLNLHWRYNPAWELRVEGARFSTVCVAHERFQWGPFFQWNTGVWAVHRDRQTQQFRMTNCILGMGANYGHRMGSGATLSVFGDLGFTFNNVFRIRDASGDHTLEKFRAHPGLYTRFGLRYAF